MRTANQVRYCPARRDINQQQQEQGQEQQSQQSQQQQQPEQQKRYYQCNKGCGQESILMPSFLRW
jgi:hypothetical protein